MPKLTHVFSIFHGPLYFHGFPQRCPIPLDASNLSYQMFAFDRYTRSCVFFSILPAKRRRSLSTEEEVSNDARQLLQSKSLSLSQNSSHIDWIISMYRVDGIVVQGRLKSFSRGKTGSCGGVASSRGVGGIVEGSKFLSSRCQVAEDGVETSRWEGGVDNEIRLRTELEGCDRMIVGRYKALGNKAATISPGNIPQDSRPLEIRGHLPSRQENETKSRGNSNRHWRNNFDRQRCCVL